MTKDGVFGIADHVALIGDGKVAIEVKYVDNWSKSIRNPESVIGKKDFTRKAHTEMITQAQKYEYNNDFDQIIYHTNDIEFAKFYSKQFEEQGIKKVKFSITPAVRGDKR